MQSKISPGARLRAVADAVRPGAFLADIGTDHAYLPVMLCQSGRITGALASDLRAGPVARAEETVKSHGMAGRITVRLADGLAAVPEFPVTDISVAGMGGLLIRDIIQAAPFVRNSSYRLILQPQRHAAELRVYLAASGFDIVSETVAREDNRFYQIIAAEYTGSVYTLSPVHALIGRPDYSLRGDDFPAMLSHIITTARRDGKLRADAGIDVSRERELTDELERILWTLKN